MVELRGLEPLTSSMPWWLRRSKRRAASVDVVPGRAGGATSIQPGSPSICPPRLEPPAVREPGPSRTEPFDLVLDRASVRVHAGSGGASQALAAHRRRSPCRHIRRYGSSYWLQTAVFCALRWELSGSGASALITDQRRRGGPALSHRRIRQLVPGHVGQVW